MSGSADGIGSNALFSSPRGVSVSPDGSYALVADYGNHMIRKIVITSGLVSTLAGSTVSGSANGVGTNAQFSYPFSLASHEEKLFFCELGLPTLRQVLRYSDPSFNPTK